MAIGLGLWVRVNNVVITRVSRVRVNMTRVSRVMISSFRITGLGLWGYGYEVGVIG